MTAPLLQVDNLSTEISARGRKFDVLRGVSLHVDAAERVGVVGESGSGKSMTALSILRLLPPAARLRAGSVRFAGRDLSQMPERELASLRGRGIAAVFQDPMTSLNPVLKIGRQLTDHMQHHLRLGGEECRVRALGLLERVKVPRAVTVMDSYPHQLSGGMRQRVAIAMALACKPKLLLADEPTTALDVMVQADVIALLQELTAQDATAVILISHSLDLVAQYCDRICVMYAGRIVETASTADLVRAARHPYTRDLISSAPNVDAPRVDRFLSIQGQPPQPGALSAGCPYQPRCRLAVDLCSRSEPELVGERHAVACWRAGEVA